MIELKHSKKLSKRVKKDKDFKTLLFPQLTKAQKLEEGINEIQLNKSDHTLFSELGKVDTEEQLDKFEAGQLDERDQAIIRKFKVTQSLLEKKRLKRLKWFQKNMFLKPLCIIRHPKLMQGVRFFDFTFPLDSKIFADTFDETSKLFNLPQNVYDYKRAHSATFDKEKSLFSVEISEKISRKDLENHSFSLQNYYIEWLRYSGNAKALPLIEIQLKFKDYHKSSKENEFFTLLTKNNELKFSENKDKQKIDKFFLKTISKDDMDFISKSPYMSRTHKRDLLGTNEDNGLVQEEFNMELCKLLGYQDTDVDEILSKSLKFDIQNSMYIKNYINGMNNLIEIQKHRHLFSYCDGQTNSPALKISEKVQVLKKDKEKSMECTLITQEENWIENGCLYKKNYIAWTDAVEMN